MNLKRAVRNFLFPTALFVTVLGCLIFRLRYQAGSLAAGLKLLAELCGGALCVAMFVHTCRARSSLLWPVFFTLCMIVSDLGAAVIGEWTWKALSEPEFDFEALATYMEVDVHSSGKRYSDAGRVYFVAGTRVEKDAASCFVNERTYCIAPIVRGAGNSSQNFFSSGIDCCDCPVTTWRCGAWEDPFAASGLRQVNNADLAFYRLAADKWSVEYAQSVADALFFEFTKDPKILQESYGIRKADIFLWGSVLAFLVFGAASVTLEFVVANWPASPPEEKDNSAPKYI
mmetsp:Transcript_52921/g.140707  ORF Transcript_52921/g.140707 Transcript_52921/m.140707 type:complete len:286 (-) Transcript_52921:59-916(-)